MPLEREKRSPGGGCGKRNETATANGSNSTVTARGTNNPDVETLARRKRSPVEINSDSEAIQSAPSNGPSSNGPPPKEKPNDDKTIGIIILSNCL